MSDLTQLVPQSHPVVIGGKAYNVLPFTINEVTKIQLWINKTYPDPLGAFLAVINDMSPEVRRDVLTSARGWRPPRLGSVEANEYLESLDGLQAVFSILIKRADPSVTDEKIQDLQGSMTFAQFTALMEELMVIAFGKDEGPKAPGVE